MYAMASIVLPELFNIDQNDSWWRRVVRVILYACVYVAAAAEPADGVGRRRSGHAGAHAPGRRGRAHGPLRPVRHVRRRVPRLPVPLPRRPAAPAAPAAPATSATPVNVSYIAYTMSKLQGCSLWNIITIIIIINTKGSRVGNGMYCEIYIINTLALLLCYQSNITYFTNLNVTFFPGLLSPPLIPAASV